MAYPPGFNYVSGEFTIRRFPVTSTGTFLKRNPVSIGADGVVSEFSLPAVSIAGIAMSDSSESEAIAGVNTVLVGVFGDDTIFATKIQTNVATSALTAYNAFNLEKATNHWRPDTDSTVTKWVQLVPRGDGTVDARSDDSTVLVQFMQGKQEPFRSNTTVLVG